MRRVATAESLDKSKFTRRYATRKSFADVLQSLKELPKLILPLRGDRTVVLLWVYQNLRAMIAACSIILQKILACGGVIYAD
jgi:hypothetical protein